MPTPPDLDPVALNRERSELESLIKHSDEERAKIAALLAGHLRRSRYLRLARWIRTPAASFPAYPMAVFLIAPLLTGVAAFIAVSLLVDSWSIALGSFIVGALGGAALAGAMLSSPSDQLLPSELAAAETARESAAMRLNDVTSTLAEARTRLTQLQNHHRELATSEKLQRTMLLQRDWRSLRGSEWEDFVVEVCRTLGAHVQRGPVMNEPALDSTTPTRGPRGVVRRPLTTLYVTFSPRRIAVAAVSEVNPFHPAAVQQVAGQLAQQGCETLGMITNARVTTGSKELARSRNCTLIGEEDFPDFVLGRLPI